MNHSPLSSLPSLPTFGAPTLEGLDTSRMQGGERVPGVSNRQFVQFYNNTYSEIRATKVHKNEKTGEVIVLESKAFPVTKEFVKIVTPGDTNEVDQPAEEYHKREFFRQYQAFRDGKAAPLGQPIDDCTYIGPQIISELRYRGVHTEEQLAEASDLLCNGIPNGTSLREYARAACEARMQNKTTPALMAMSAQLEKAMARISELETSVKERQQIVNPAGEVLTTETVKRGPGRPRKEENVEAA